jgi:hypothetical protein
MYLKGNRGWQAVNKAKFYAFTQHQLTRARHATDIVLYFMQPLR